MSLAWRGVAWMLHYRGEVFPSLSRCLYISPLHVFFFLDGFRFASARDERANFDGIAVVSTSKHFRQSIIYITLITVLVPCYRRRAEYSASVSFANEIIHSVSLNAFGETFHNSCLPYTSVCVQCTGEYIQGVLVRRILPR